jgi:uncharacterized protein (DUF58 family)
MANPPSQGLMPERQISARRAEALAARLPPLLVAAERVAATVAQGVHGRRRVGQGESFWQFRPFLPGDGLTRIDWRQSAKSDRAFVRETEWEAAQTVCLWRDGSASMRWKSRGAAVEKRERAELLLLALAALLLRGGERVRLITAGGTGSRITSGSAALEGLADALARGDGCPPEAVGRDMVLPRHARAVLIGDFLAPLEGTRDMVGRLAAMPLRGHLVQILDPAEAVLPYSGRVRFFGVSREQETTIPRVEGVREAYANRLAAQQQGLADLCSAAGFTFSIHHTDHPPETALQGLFTSLSGR